MDIAGIAKSSLVDYPGLIACVLFVPGCNYDCFYCHNRSLIDGSYELLDPQYIENFLAKRVGLLDGVVITGGEPTLQPDLIFYAKRMKKLGYKVKLDTNGSNPKLIEKLLNTKIIDYYAVDYKAPSKKYDEIGCSSPDSVLQTINLLIAAGIEFEVRTTVFPQLRTEDLITMAQELPKLPRYVLNPYNKPDKYLQTDQVKVEQTPYTLAQIKAFAESMKKYQPNIII